MRPAVHSSAALAIAVSLSILSTGCAQWVAIAPEDAPRLVGPTHHQSGERYSSYCRDLDTCGTPVTAAERRTRDQNTMSFTEPVMRRSRVQVTGDDGPIEVQPGRAVRLTVDGRVQSLGRLTAARVVEGRLVVKGSAASADVSLADIERLEVQQPNRSWWVPVVGLVGAVAVIVGIRATMP